MFPVCIKNGGGRIAQIYKSVQDVGEEGLMVYNTPRYERDGVNNVFISPERGLDMNINGADSPSITEDVYQNGISSGWAASVISGSWNFTDTYTGDGGNWPIVGTLSIDCRQANNNNQARLESTIALDLTAYDFIRGYAFVDSWSTGGTAKEVTLEIRDATDTIIGNAVNLSSYIDSASFDVPQAFKIPISAFNATNQSMKSVVITVIDNGGGAAPNILLDDIQFQDGGSGYLYSIRPTNNRRLFIDRIKIRMEGPYNVTTSAQHAVSMSGFLNIAKLGNGIQTGVSTNGVFDPGKSVVIRELRDWLKFPQGSDFSSYGDGTNTAIEFNLDFVNFHGLTLDPKRQEEFSFRIQDDLSSLTFFQIWAEGHEFLDG